MADSLKERQEDELQVLQAVFMDDYEDLRKKDAWKVHRPPEVKLSLKPQESFGNQGGEVYVKVDLVISCPDRYPEEVPEVRLENHKGLSNQQLAALKADLEKEAKRLCGQEMLLELSQVVQAFLYANNKPPPKSFYEEMMSNKRKQEEKQKEEQKKRQEFLKKKEEKEIQNIEVEIQKRHEALKEETRKRKEESRQANLGSSITAPATPTGETILSTYSPIKKDNSPLIDTPKAVRTRASLSPSPAIVQRATSETDTKSTRRSILLLPDMNTTDIRTSTPRCGDDDQLMCKDHTGGIVVLGFNTKAERIVHRGTCLGHGNNGSTVYAGLDTKTGDLVAIAEWVLKWRHMARKKQTETRLEGDKEAETYQKQILSIEQELFTLMRLHHRNLIHYLAMKYLEEAGKITVYLLMEYTGGQNLSIYLKRKTLALDVLRSYTEELLEALEYLHNKAVVHKNLRASSVFVDAYGRVRLADYSIDKRLCELYQTVEKAKPGVKFTDSTPPILGRSGKKGDIYQLGLLLLSLSQGSQVEDVIPSVPTSLPSVFQDFLSKCLMKDDRLRWSSTQLLDHTFLKEPIPDLMPPADGEPELKNTDENNSDDEEESSPLITAWEASGQSRLTNEFDVLKLLGKGGFGDVIKVKNKLDGQMYAIKRIPLNPKSQHFNKKITREVKLLSRLNHENVVRYYNSWIETSDDAAQSDTSSSFSSTPKTSESEKKVSLPQGFRKNSLDLTDDIEKFAPQVAETSTDFSISYEASRSRSHRAEDSSDSSDSEFEEEEDVFGGLSFMMLSDDSSGSVVFEHNFDENELSASQAEEKDKKEDVAEENQVVPKLQYLYIQMEYCEKSTLRNCIDAGLYQDMDRVWRLFREMVEGLLHIHEQGMIHRDLKPVNIFLDSNDHVKIGDFGLATSDVLSKNTLKDQTLLLTSACDIHGSSSSRSGSLGDGNLTGVVGTALYVSPEIITGPNTNKVTYSQKVDIYSLGVIFFEMCYKPLPTGMERVKILGHLRLEEINFPEDFDQIQLQNQHHIIRWLLNHDPIKRPTSKELLQSEYLPPPQMEEAELNEILRSTISDPHSKSYRRMISAMFSQSVSLADDHIYDSDLQKGSFSVNTALTHSLVQESLVRIFQRHGAIKLNTPLLVPRPKMFENVDQYACLMDHSGRLVGLPFDLRVPFARYVARTNLYHIKRYCIEKVYREKKVFGFHPKELTECAFDIVTSTPGSLIPDAEVLVVVQDVINEFPPLQQRNYYYRLNHTSLLKAVLLHAGVSEDSHAALLNALSEVKRDSKSRLKVLTNFSLNDQQSSTLLTFLETEGQYGKVASVLKTITKTDGPAGSAARQGLHELETVISNATSLGLKLPVIVSLGWIYNLQQYSGLLFQVCIDFTRKKKIVSEVFAAGGRYDKLISHFYSPLFCDRSVSVQPSGVGVSIAFEKIVSAMLEQEDNSPPSAYDILVCTIGRKPMLKERMALVRDLWSAGLRAEILLETREGQEEFQEFCRVHGISQLVIFKDSEGGTVKVRSIEKEKVTEKPVSTQAVVEFLQQKLSSNKIEQEVNQSAMNKTSSTSQLHTDIISTQVQGGGNVSMNFTFIMAEDKNKIALNTRRKYEAQVVAKVNSSFPWLSTKCLEVVAVELTVTTLRVVAAHLDVDTTESAFEASISVIVEKQQRYRKYLSKITDHIHKLVFQEKCKCILLYGMKDDSAKLLTCS